MKKQLAIFLESIKQERQYSDNTIAAYRNDLNQFDAFLAEYSLSSWQDVTEAIVKQYVKNLKTHTYASSSVARKVAAVKSFFQYLHSRSIIKENPASDIDSPKVKKRLPKTLSNEDVERLLNAPSKQKTPKNIRDKALLDTLYTTGMRVTELVTLTIDDVDFAKEMLHCQSKEENHRDIPLGTETAKILHDYLEHARPHLVKDPAENALFLNHRGNQLTRQGLWLIIKSYAQSIHLGAAVTPHTLRHSFASHKLNNGTDIKEIQHLLGHANISTTQIYTQLIPDEDTSGS